MNQYTNILSIDPSSSCTGYALFQDKKLIDYGCWNLKNIEEKDWRKRISFMAEHISNYCNTHQVDYIVSEDVVPSVQNSQTVKILSALQGMLISLGVAHNIPIEFVSVTTWKNKLGVQIDKSSEGRAMTKKVKVNKPKSYDKFHGWVKGYGKKISVDYANYTFGLDLVYVSPSSKKNQDDIADAINIGYSVICDSPDKYGLEDFGDIMDKLYECL